MRKITFRLVETTENQRFYEVSEYLTKGFIRLTGQMVEWNAEKVRNRIKEGSKHFAEENGFKVVCISDAHTHIERLAFAATKFPSEYGRLDFQIEGLHTMMIYGGDPSSVWEDEKYLRLIARHNGYSQNNVIIKK